MLANTSIIAIVPINDMAVAEQFYAGTLGLTVVERSPFALVVATNSGQTIRLTPVPGGVKPEPFTRVGWEVEDIYTAAGELRAAGIDPIVYPQFVQDEDGVWTAPAPPGTFAPMVLWFHDPDKNILSLSQHKAL